MGLQCGCTPAANELLSGLFTLILAAGYFKTTKTKYMEASELRINNYTNLGKIKSFYESGVHLGMGATCLYSDLKPVALTEELLLKLGFVKKGKRWSKDWFYLWEDNYNIVFALAEMQESIGKYLNIEHVHQLQNLYFALTGEELTIKD